MRKYNKILIYSKHVQKKKPPRQKQNNHTAKKKKCDVHQWLPLFKTGEEGAVALIHFIRQFKVDRHPWFKTYESMHFGTFGTLNIHTHSSISMLGIWCKSTILINCVTKYKYLRDLISRPISSWFTLVHFWGLHIYKIFIVGHV